MMFEWIFVAVIWAAAIVMVAHTIDEAVSCAAPLRARSHRGPGNPVPEGRLAVRVYQGNDDKARKRAA